MSAQASSSVARPRRWPRAVVFALLVAIVWLAIVRVPGEDVTAEIDASWQRALIYFHEHGLRAGNNWVFTYGPLGYLETRFQVASVFWQRMVLWELGLRVAIAAFLVRAGVRIDRRVERAVFLAMLLALPISLDGLSFVAVLAITTALARRERDVGVELGLGLVALATIGLAKFSWQLAVLPCVGLLAVEAAIVRSRRVAFVTIGIYAASYLVLWKLSGQAFVDLPACWIGSFEVASGYDDAMGRDGQSPSLWIPVAVAALMLAVHALQTRERREQLLGLALGAVGFLAYKASFVSGGSTETLGEVCAVAPLFVATPIDKRRAVAARVARFAVVAIGLYLLPLAHSFVTEPGSALARRFGELRDNAAAFVDLPALHEQVVELDARVQHMYELPRVRATVASSSIDMLGSRQALLILNELDYRPRPVFQSYVAYTPQLRAMNERYFAGPSAPDFVLMRLDDLLGRMVMLDDTPALELVLASYEPLFVERGCLLMKRARDVAPRGERSAIEATVELNHWFELPPSSADCRRLSFEMEPTLAGRARGFLLRTPTVQLEVRLENGDVTRRRILPGVMSQGVIVDPYVRSHYDLTRWMCGEVPPRVRAVRVVVADELTSCFEPTLRMHLAELARPLREPFADRDALLMAMFPRAPIEVRSMSSVETMFAGQNEFLIARAPAGVCFDVEPGTQRVSGVVGLSTENQGGDGIVFRVRVVDATGTERVVDELPVAPPTGSPFAFALLKTRIKIDSPARVWIDADPGADDRGDFALYSHVAVEPVRERK